MARTGREKTAPQVAVRGASANVDLVAGAGANTNIAIAAIRRGDILTKVIEVPAAAALVDRTAVASITSDGNIQLTAATTGNQLLVFWLRGRR